MSPHAPTNGLNVMILVGVGILSLYLYQIGSRKQERIRYKIRRTIVAIVVYLAAALILVQQGLPPVEVVLIGGLAGMGCAWLLLTRRSRNQTGKSITMPEWASNY